MFGIQGSVRTAAVALVAAGALATTAAASSAAVGSPRDLPAPTSTSTAHRDATGSATLVAVRVGRHADYDRVVYEFSGALPGWTVGYVPAVYADGSGAPVPLRGPAMLRVLLQGAAAHDDSGSSTLRTAASMTPELPTLRQVRDAGDFEGVVTSGLGLRDRVGFRVFGLANPTRVVVDVAHQPRIAFGTAAVSRPGSAADVLATGVRTAAHPGYDRSTFDLAGAARPAVRVAYAASGTGIDVTLTAAGTPSSAPHASFIGVAPAATGLSAIYGVSLVSTGGGSLTFHLATGAQDGFRVLLLAAPARVVVDVAH